MRVINRDFEIEPLAMVITASCGVLFNIFMFIMLETGICFRNAGHIGHNHSHGHHDTKPSETAKRSIESDNIFVHKNTLDQGHSHHDTKSSQTPIELDEIVVHQSKSDQPMPSMNIKRIFGLMKRKNDNINIRAAVIHVIGDFIQSVGVLIAAIIIYINVSSILVFKIFLIDINSISNYQYF